MRHASLFLALAIVLPAWTAPRASRVRTVSESARQIPVAYDVDVLVVGGATRGVAAAAAAADAGASVLLIDDRPYLGSDMCGTYQLWFEPGESPKTDLGRQLFAGTSERAALPPGPKFTYVASRQANPKHGEVKNAPRLSDGRYNSAAHDSVQYDGDVELKVDLGKPQQLTGIRLFAYNRPADFVIAQVRLAVSTDGTNWHPAGTAANANPNGFNASADPVVDFPIETTATARYLKLSVNKTADSSRVLLGELIVQTAAAEPEPATTKPQVVTPMHVKRTLDQALLSRNVDFLYGTYPTDLLHDPNGEIAGLLVANRSGRQAVRAKVIVDATHRATVARLAGANFVDYPVGKQTFTRIVAGGKPGPDAKDLGILYHVDHTKGKSYSVYRYQLELDMPDASWASFTKADTIARNQTWHDGQVSASEFIFQTPPAPLKSRSPQSTAWGGPDKLNLDACRPATIDHLYVLGGCADVRREDAAKLLRPFAGIQLGQRLGTAAAADAAKRTLPPAAKLAVAHSGKPATITADVGEFLGGLRWRADNGALGVINSPDRALPVLARYDTVVVGGGTGGGPAGIGAARGGARTLVIEYLYALGGVGTVGRISKYYHGNRVGFTAEVDDGVTELTPGGKANSRNGWNIEAKQEWLRREIDKAGGDLWLLSLGCGAVVKDKRFTGVVVATPFGRGVVLANTVIDSTGNAVIPASAGLPTQEIDGEHVSVQGTGLPPQHPGDSYHNTDWTFMHDDDVLDMWRINVVAKSKYKNAFDLGQLVDTRARRRIVGDLMVHPMDIVNQRVYSDVITVSKSNFDNHGFSSHDLFMVTPPDKKGLVGNVPYRALLPKGYDGILVTGLGISAHGDAMPVLRMQPDVQNHGYAAGRASAMVAEAGTTVRNVDIPKLQKHLVEVGIIPEKFIGAKDSYPIGLERMQTAVQAIGKDYSGIAIVLTQPDTALPMLQDAYRKATDDAAKLRFAHVLGMLHDPTGVDTLIKAVKAHKWDKGWNFRGMGQFGATTSYVDNLVIALGRTKDPKALPAIIEKANQITENSEFSHSRAVAMACETLRSPQAAPALARILQLPGVGGHAFTDIHETIKRTPANQTDNTTRNNSLRELVIARALYRCGDHNGLGRKTLAAYGADFRGHYAAHAQAVMADE